MLLAAGPAAKAQTNMHLSPGLQLAVELAEEEDYDAAAIEYRRLALHSDVPAHQASYYWMAAYQYLQEGDTLRIPDLLDRVEDADPHAGPPAMLLRGEAALQARRFDQAVFYMESIMLSSALPAPWKNYAGRRLAAIQIRQGAFDRALRLLPELPGDQYRAIQAVQTYAAGSDKKPWLGGLLGVIPGFGYFYSGEWGNGLRSIILNGIFIFGLIDTADREAWGAFTVISFFELTWYTGSIYGGVDAAHRYNRQRMETCLDTVRGNSDFFPDIHRLPVLYLDFEF
jgi:tetratricopeptide (TPR) repeat protein